MSQPASPTIARAPSPPSSPWLTRKLAAVKGSPTITDLLQRNGHRRVGSASAVSTARAVASPVGSPLVRRSQTPSASPAVSRRTANWYDDHEHWKGVVWNFRDIAQAPTLRSKNTLRQGLIYRSAAFHRGVNPNESDPQVFTKKHQQICKAVEFLKDEIQVKTIIDLRTGVEKFRDKYEATVERVFPTVGGLRASNGRRRYHIPLLTRSLIVRGLFWPCDRTVKMKMLRNITEPQVMKDIFMKESFNQIGLAGLNKCILTHSGEQIARILRICSDASNYPIMFHCTSGKDRTGLIAALILACCGIDFHDIVQNYHHSDVCLGPINEIIIQENRKEGMSEHFDLCPPKVMEDTLNFIVSTWGSVHAYLESIGFDQADQLRLQSILIEERPDADPPK